MDAGENLDLRLTECNYIKRINLNIELIGLGSHYLVSSDRSSYSDSVLLEDIDTAF